MSMNNMDPKARLQRCPEGSDKDTPNHTVRPSRMRTTQIKVSGDLEKGDNYGLAIAMWGMGQKQ